MTSCLNYIYLKIFFVFQQNVVVTKTYVNEVIIIIFYFFFILHKKLSQIKNEIIFSTLFLNQGHFDHNLFLTRV
jgi:hypothetical protein